MLHGKVCRNPCNINLTCTKAIDDRITFPEPKPPAISLTVHNRLTCTSLRARGEARSLAENFSSGPSAILSGALPTTPPKLSKLRAKSATLTAVYAGMRRNLHMYGLETHARQALIGSTGLIGAAAESAICKNALSAPVVLIEKR